MAASSRCLNDLHARDQRRLSLYDRINQCATIEQNADHNEAMIKENEFSFYLIRDLRN